MKIDNRKIMIYGSLGVIGAILAYLGYNKYAKNQEYKQLMSDLQKDTGATGTIEDLRVTAFSASFYKGKPANSLFTAAAIAKLASDMHDNIHGLPIIPLTSNPDRVISLFSQYQTKAQVSQTAEAYNKRYNTDFLKELEGIGSDHTEVIKKMIVNLPDQKK